MKQNAQMKKLVAIPILYSSTVGWILPIGETELVDMIGNCQMCAYT